MKTYKAIFFDWDGTAVYSRKAPTADVAAAMKPLLHRGVKLAIISGTTLENIGGGRLHEQFTPVERQNLYYGLARGALNYRFDEQGRICEFASGIPDRATLLRMHEACFQLHKWLLREHDLPTDIVFSRPNYCKIDLVATDSRGDNLFMQGGELSRLEALLQKHGISGTSSLIRKAEEIGSELGLILRATTDAKYLEVGLTLKTDNVNAIFRHLSQEYDIQASECSFWGDEFVQVGVGMYGSDSCMLTDMTYAGDFFDVSEVDGQRPERVQRLGGGVERFLSALQEQEYWHGPKL